MKVFGNTSERKFQKILLRNNQKTSPPGGLLVLFNKMIFYFNISLR